jgi:hypothetical protein
MHRAFLKRTAAVIGTIVSWVYAILDFLFDWVVNRTPF